MHLLCKELIQGMSFYIAEIFCSTLLLLQNFSKVISNDIFGSQKIWGKMRGKKNREEK